MIQFLSLYSYRSSYRCTYDSKKTFVLPAQLWYTLYCITDNGAWRSLVARTAGGREVAGSNPVAPIFYLAEIISCPHIGNVNPPDGGNYDFKKQSVFISD